MKTVEIEEIHVDVAVYLILILTCIAAVASLPWGRDFITAAGKQFLAGTSFEVAALAGGIGEDPGRTAAP